VVVHSPPRTSAHSGGDVFLTGATGFLGTALLARLAASSESRRTWALVRAHTQEEAQARLVAALSVVLPDRSAWEDRVIAVPGDLTEPALGLEGSLREEIAARVTQVIHAAASVSFTLPLEQAREINVKGTRRVLELAEHCAARGGLHRMSHVSTAYVAGTHSGVFDEDDHDVGQEFHNAYEQTKWEAELLVRAHAGQLPLQVLRPSIVVGDERTGWTSSFNVIYSPLRAFARGALPAIPARRSAPLDVVSVSYVADAILALADGDHPCRTYHLTAGPEAGTVGELIELSARTLERKPPVTLPPRLYRGALHPLLLRRSSGARLRWLERSEVFFPYFAPTVRFDASRARQALEPHGVHPAPLAEYFGRLMTFAQRTDWGRRPDGHVIEPRRESGVQQAPAVTGRPAHA
jgi:thioester reductase-like protein